MPYTPPASPSSFAASSPTNNNTNGHIRRMVQYGGASLSWSLSSDNDDDEGAGTGTATSTRSPASMTGKSMETAIPVLSSPDTQAGKSVFSSSSDDDDDDQIPPPAFSTKKKNLPHQPVYRRPDTCGSAAVGDRGRLGTTTISSSSGAQARRLITPRQAMRPTSSSGDARTASTTMARRGPRTKKELSARMGGGARTAAGFYSSGGGAAKKPSAVTAVARTKVNRRPGSCRPYESEPTPRKCGGTWAR